MIKQIADLGLMSVLGTPMLIKLVLRFSLLAAVVLSNITLLVYLIFHKRRMQANLGNENTIVQRNVRMVTNARLVFIFSVASFVISLPVTFFWGFLAVSKPTQREEQTQDSNTLELIGSVLTFFETLSCSINFFVLFLSSTSFKASLKTYFHYE